MKQKLLASAAIVLGAALAAPAAADISLTDTVIYDKEVRITETLRKTKTVTISVTVDIDRINAAESNAVVNQRIGGCGTERTATCDDPALGFGTNVGHTYVTGTFAGATGRTGVDYVALVSGSIIRNLGVTQFNQDVGVGSNQNNLLSAAAAETGLFLEANNSSAQYNFNNTVTVDGRRLNGEGTADDRVGLIHAAVISTSVVGNVGVVQVNQNAGVFNNQLNSMSLAFSLNGGDAVALANSDLGQWNSGGRATETNTARTAAMAVSVNGNIGVVMGNQSAGYMGNQANIVSLSAGGLF